ncbi:hypothetical protein NB311A_08944 [Nitrobacter sp. Nb-311A]|nr:hypothetical protein NB311A_08944 [Nitrobacter sp. Nb-311A]
MINGAAGHKAVSHGFRTNEDYRIYADP